MKIYIVKQYTIFKEDDPENIRAFHKHEDALQFIEKRKVLDVQLAEIQPKLYRAFRKWLDKNTNMYQHPEAKVVVEKIMDELNVPKGEERKRYSEWKFIATEYDYDIDEVEIQDKIQPEPVAEVYYISHAGTEEDSYATVRLLHRGISTWDLKVREGSYLTLAEEPNVPSTKVDKT